MTNEDDLVTHLMSFGLSAKEAHCYLHLLRYGPSAPSPLAKSLKTYRVNVHRTLNSLIEKGMVRHSLSSPTVYTAVELDAALESALKKHESELHEMERRKMAAAELVRQQRLRTYAEVASYKIIRNLNELTGVSLSLAQSIKEEHLFVLPTGALSIGALAGITDTLKRFSRRGVSVRGIVDISGTDPSRIGTELVQELLDEGIVVRFLDHYRGLYFSVSDKKMCVSIINVDVHRTSLSAPISALWAEDRAYAESLASTFELLWDRAIPADEWIATTVVKQAST